MKSNWTLYCSELILDGAGFSSQLKRPLKLEISLDERQDQELGCIAAATVRYELKTERNLFTHDIHSTFGRFVLETPGLSNAPVH